MSGNGWDEILKGAKNTPPTTSKCPTEVTNEMLDFQLSKLERNLDGQWESLDRVTTRSAAILAVILASAGALSLGTAFPQIHVELYAFIFSMILLGAAAFLAVLSMRIADFHYGPRGEALAGTLYWDLRDVKWRVVGELASAIPKNRSTLEERSTLLNISLLTI